MKSSAQVHEEVTGAPGEAPEHGLLGAFFATWRFPVFALTILFGLMLFLVGVLLVPQSAGVLGAFANDFRIWCFGSDPTSGGVEWIYVWASVMPPFMLGGILTFVWWETLSDVFRRRPRELYLCSGSAITGVALMATLLVGMDRAPGSDNVPFPAERLRTEYRAPQFSLTNFDGETVSLKGFDGKVVLLTAVYASCGYTCPMIMAETRKVVAGLTDDELSNLRIIAITLDPERDSPERLAEMARAQKLPTPLYSLLSGKPDEVNGLLDKLQVARTRNAETGEIDHANLFFVVDSEGRIAYRLSLSDKNQHWLLSAVRVLIEEARASDA
jgi:cytochrome oxidase Cu insertion factor (SCO1/SenC/PrrC family)